MGWRSFLWAWQVGVAGGRGELNANWAWSSPRYIPQVSRELQLLDFMVGACNVGLNRNKFLPSGAEWKVTIGKLFLRPECLI